MIEKVVGGHQISQEQAEALYVPDTTEDLHTFKVSLLASTKHSEFEFINYLTLSTL